MAPLKNPSQKSRYTVPVAVAVAAHAFLFFGFTPAKVLPPPNPHLSTPVPEPRVDPVLVDLVKPESDSEARDSLSQRQVTAAPTQSEFIPDVIPNSAITVPVVVVQPGPIDPKNRVLPSGPPQIGTLDGIFQGPSIVGLHDLDAVPRVTFQARPDYPFTLRHQGIPGEVVVNFLVDEQGRVSDVQVVRSTHAEFEPSTVRAVGKWRFEPGKRNGRAVRFRMSQVVSFALGE